jgi:hypothetical protein
MTTRLKKENKQLELSVYDLFDESTIDDVITQLISLKCKISDGYTHAFEYDTWEHALNLCTWRYETDAEIAEREQKDHQKEQKLADAKQVYELSELARLKAKYEN